MDTNCYTCSHHTHRDFTTCYICGVHHQTPEKHLQCIERREKLLCTKLSQPTFWKQESFYRTQLVHNAVHREHWQAVQRQ